MEPIQLSLIVSVFNEEKILNHFFSSLFEIIKKTNINYEIIFVNDGSNDNSHDILKEIKKTNENINIINFSRNFGHEAAMIAGIDKSKGQQIICLDADMQHPPELILEMYSKTIEGYHIVNMVRVERKDGGLWKRFTSKIFYNLINSITPIKLEPNATDFFLISRKVADIIKNDFRERTRFMRGFIQTIGFKKTKIEFISPERIEGESKYNFLKLYILSISAIASFSKFPLRIGTISGLIFGIISVVVGIFSIVMRFLEKPVPGYTTIVVLISFMFCIQFIILGIIGEYIGFLFDEAKRRPLYIIDEDAESFD